LSTNLDFKGMIEANYNVLSNLEANIQAFFKTFENVDTKIVEKETAFINAKQEFKTLIEDYKSTLDKIREDFNLAVAKEQKEFIEVVNTNTNKILEIKKEELKQKLEVEEHNIILKAKNLLEAMKNFEDNINSKIADTIKNLPVELENQKDLYINKTLEAIKDTSKTLKTDIEDYRKVLDEELMKYKDTVLVQINTCKDSLKSSTEAIKEVAENIKKENITLNKSRSNLETDYKKINNNLEVVNRNTTNLINSVSNINYTFIINKIYILLFSLLNSIFIFRIIVPTDYRFNFKSKFTLWILIIIGVLLIFLAIGDIINYLLNMLVTEEEKEDD
jgi:prophage DNA circulation protein